FARFPDVMAFPEGEPWLHYADSLPFPVEFSSRMHLITPAKASKDVSRRLAHARDMDAHIREAGAEAPLALAEQIAAARMLEHGITKERLPFVYGWHRVLVTAARRSPSTTGTSASTWSTPQATSSRCFPSRCQARRYGSPPTCSASRSTR